MELSVLSVHWQILRGKGIRHFKKSLSSQYAVDKTGLAERGLRHLMAIDARLTVTLWSEGHWCKADCHILVRGPLMQGWLSHFSQRTIDARLTVTFWLEAIDARLTVTFWSQKAIDARLTITFWSQVHQPEFTQKTLHSRKWMEQFDAVECVQFQSYEGPLSIHCPLPFV